MQLCLGNANVWSVTFQHSTQQAVCAVACSVADGQVTLPALYFCDFCQVLKISNVLNLIAADLSHLLMCKFGSVRVNVCKHVDLFSKIKHVELCSCEK
jgi:hypothetical protein